MDTDLPAFQLMSENNIILKYIPEIHFDRRKNAYFSILQPWVLPRLFSSAWMPLRIVRFR